MAIGNGFGNNDNSHYWSNQISRQGQMQLNSMKGPTGMISRQDLLAFKNSSIYGEYRQVRAQENSANNLQSLAQTADMYRQMSGMNIDVNQLAAMYDTDGNGLLSGKELQKAEKGLQNMYMQYSQQNMAAMNGGMGNYGNMGAAGGYSDAGFAGVMGGGMEMGSTFSVLKNGLGDLFNGIGGLTGKSEQGGDGGNFFSKLGKLFG